MMQPLCSHQRPSGLSCAAAPFTKQAHIPNQGNLPNQLLFYRPVSAHVVRAKKNTVMQEEAVEFFFPLSLSSSPVQISATLTVIVKNIRFFLMTCFSLLCPCRTTNCSATTATWVLPIPCLSLALAPMCPSPAPPEPCWTGRRWDLPQWEACTSGGTLSAAQSSARTSF